MRTTVTARATSCSSTGPSTRSIRASAGRRFAASMTQVDPLYDLGEIVDQFRSSTAACRPTAAWSRGPAGRLGAALDRRPHLRRRAVSRAASSSTGTTSLVPEDRKLVYPWIGFDLVAEQLSEAQEPRPDRAHRGFPPRHSHHGARWAGRYRLSAPTASAVMFACLGRARHSPTRASTLLLFRRFSAAAMRTARCRTGCWTLPCVTTWSSQHELAVLRDPQGTTGHNLDLDNQILLGGDNGLRGYPLRYQGGDSAGAADRRAALLHRLVSVSAVPGGRRGLLSTWAAPGATRR